VVGDPHLEREQRVVVARASGLLGIRTDGLEGRGAFFAARPDLSEQPVRQIGDGLGRRKSKFRGHLINTMTAPLALMARTGDRLGVRLLRP
jgi:hypothetical protein